MLSGRMHKPEELFYMNITEMDREIDRVEFSVEQRMHNEFEANMIGSLFLSHYYWEQLPAFLRQPFPKSLSVKVKLLGCFSGK